jgi:hypothetical protein
VQQGPCQFGIIVEIQQNQRNRIAQVGTVALDSCAGAYFLGRVKLGTWVLDESELTKPKSDYLSE